MLSTICPNYEPVTNWVNHEKVDMNIRELQTKYPNGCKCCGNIYMRSDFSRMISSHFVTKKHKKNVLIPANEEFHTDFSDINDINKAYEEKCRENRNLKQLNYEYLQDNKDLMKKNNELEDKLKNLMLI